MPGIIRVVPFSETPHPAWVGDERVDVLPRQIILWISITRPREDIQPNTPRFPALLDTGFNQNLLISPDHLRRWAHFQANHLQPIRTTRIYGEETLFRNAEVWLYRNSQAVAMNLQQEIRFLSRFTTALRFRRFLTDHASIRYSWWARFLPSNPPSQQDSDMRVNAGQKEFN